MKKYNWVKREDGTATLRKENFGNLCWPSIGTIDYLLKEKLKDNGVEALVDFDMFSFKYELIPKSIKYSFVTAPLFVYVEETKEFKLISESYTDKAIEPSQYDEVLEIYERSIKELKKEQSEKFFELFNLKSLDDGLTAMIIVSSKESEKDAFNGFLEKYIPENDLVRVIEKYDFYDNTRTEVLFMKKFDARGISITIKTPENFKGLVIGKGGENIKRIASIINARRINVA